MGHIGLFVICLAISYLGHLSGFNTKPEYRSNWYDPLRAATIAWCFIEAVGWSIYFMAKDFL